MIIGPVPFHINYEGATRKRRKRGGNKRGLMTHKCEISNLPLTMYVQRI